jgi:hypothetical protein
MYAAVADVPAVGAMFHQNHPLFTPVLWLVVRAFRACGYAGSSLLPGAAISAAFAAGAAGLFYLALRRIGAAAATAALATGAAAFSAAWWYFAGEVEVVSCISFFIAGALLILAPVPRHWGRAVAAAFWLGAATWFHITVVLFVPVAAFLLAETRENRWLGPATFGAVYVAVAAAPYVIISQITYRHAGVGGFWAWINFYGNISEAWGVLSASRFKGGLLSVLTAVASPGLDRGWDSSGMRFSVAVARFAPAAVLVGGAFATVVAAVPRLWREKRRWLLAGAFWFAGYQLFFSWWECSNVEWWVATLMPVWFLFGLAAPRRPAFVLPAAALISCLAAVNFTRLILPTNRPGRDLAEGAARVIATATQPGDVVLLSRVPVAIWLENQTRGKRTIMGSGGRGEIEEVERFIDELICPEGEIKMPPGYAFLTDYEMDNRDLDQGVAGDDVRASLFRIIRNAEPAAVVPFRGRPRVLYRCRGAAELESLSIYEAEHGTRKEEFRVLRKAGATNRFNINVPEEGQYVICIQARGTSAGDQWPAVRVAADDKTLSAFAVTTDYWWFYETNAVLGAGNHAIDVVLLNGFRDPAAGEKRFLYLNRLALYRDAGGVAPLKPFAD